MKALLYTALVLLFLFELLVQRALYSVSAKELKRRARAQDKTAARIYKLAAYGASANLFLWLVGSAGLAGLVIWTARTAPWTAAFEIFVATWLLWLPRPLKRYGNLSWKLASVLAIPRAKLTSWLQPLLKIASRFNSLKPFDGHTGAYEKADLLELLKRQHFQQDNRIPDLDLKLAFGALQFGDKTVSNVMQPKKVVKWVGQDEPIGPLLMDELHASGLSSYPVVKTINKSNATPEVVGTLYLWDLLNYSAGGKVHSVMKKDTYYINESDNLREALAAFSKTHHHLLIVINNFEEVLGILTFEQVLGQILGEKLTSDFDNYHDKKAVASHEQAAKQSEPKEPKRGKEKP